MGKNDRTKKAITLGEVLYIPFFLIFYILWIPCALLKDLATIIYTPFDIQRLYNCGCACRKNLRKGFDFFKFFPQDEDENVEVAEENTIGFKVMPSVFPAHDSIAAGLGCVDEEYDEEDNEDKNNNKK